MKCPLSSLCRARTAHRLRRRPERCSALHDQYRGPHGGLTRPGAGIGENGARNGVGNGAGNGGGGARPMTAVRRERLVSGPFLVTVLSTLLFFLAAGMTIPVLPKMVVDELHGGELAVGTVVGIFALSAVATRLWTGWLGHRFGLRPLMVVGAFLAAASIAAYGLAPNTLTLGLLRLVTGAGQALFFVGAVTLMMEVVPESRRSQAV